MLVEERTHHSLLFLACLPLLPKKLAIVRNILWSFTLGLKHYFEGERLLLLKKIEGGIKNGEVIFSWLGIF